MKYLLLFLPFFTQARTYYVGLAGDAKTTAEVNGMVLMPGDSVLFNGAENFIGQLNTKEGVYYGSYNGGAKLTGFATIRNWTNLGGGIYESPALQVSTLTMVLVNNKQQAMGRYPNKDWIYATSVSGSALPVTLGFDSPMVTNFSGAHIVQRKQHWIFDHNLVTSNTQNTLTYTEMPGSTTRQAFAKGYGFFIESHPATLDQVGEWYFNPETKRLRVFMGSTILPVKIATAYYIINAVKGVKIENLTIEGSIDHLVNVTGDNVTINKCIIQYAGRSGVSVDFNIRHRLSVVNSTIRYINDMGIYTDYRGGDYMTFTGNTMYDIGLIPGTGGWGDFGQTAIHTTGSFARIERNTLRRLGYTGIKFGDRADNIIQYNLIDSFCLTKDDGSGIYTYRGAGTFAASGNIVRNNIILNGIGNPYGTTAAATNRRDAYGIYMDENATGVLVENNTVSVAKFGIFNNNATGIEYKGNLIRDCEVAQTVWRANSLYAIRNMRFTNNQYFARNDGTLRGTAQWWEVGTGSNTIPAWGTSDSNYFISPYSNSIIGCAPDWANWKNMTLTDWKASTIYGRKDQNSVYLLSKSPVRFEYNATMTSKVIVLSKTYKDIKGRIYSGSVTLPAFSSIVLFESAVAIRAALFLDAPENPDSLATEANALIAQLYTPDEFGECPQCDRLNEIVQRLASKYMACDTMSNSLAWVLSMNLPFPENAEDILRDQLAQYLTEKTIPVTDSIMISQ